MEKNDMKILLIEDNPGDARLVEEILTEVNSIQFELTHVERLDKGLKLLRQESYDILLLDLSLPDSSGLDTFIKTHTLAPGVPIVLLTGLDDEAIAVKAVREGAQDYLVKGKFDNNMLGRALRYAVERQRLQTELRAMSIMDELTSLYNRRGFFTLVQQQIKLADRAKREMILLYIDVDGLKQINDSLGHKQGDRVLIDTANVLKKTFRKSDIIARIGGDEFVVFAIETPKECADILVTRLQKNLEVHNAHSNYNNISLSVGIAAYDPYNPCSIDELIARADALMYEKKKNKVKS